MLISQRIASYPNWLSTAHTTKSSKRVAIDLRLKIIQAVKMVVPRELFDNDRDIQGLDMQIFGHSPPTNEESQKRLKLYGAYTRLPYPLLFLENHTGGVLLEQVDKNTLDMYTVMDTGKILYFHTRVKVEVDNVDANTVFSVPVAEVKEIVSKYSDSDWNEYLKLKEVVTMVQVVGMLEMLLYVNTKNVLKHHYTPTKRENQAVPKPLLPHYSYYVLDVFKDRKEYVSMEQIQGDLCNPNKSPVVRRAGLVMGHFKKRATGLFWWNNYVRNAKNANSVGVVDKDYQVH